MHGMCGFWADVARKRLIVGTALPWWAVAKEEQSLSSGIAPRDSEAVLEISGKRRAATFGAVVLAHALLLALLASTGRIAPVLPRMLPIAVQLSTTTKPTPRLPPIQPVLEAPPHLSMPLPEIAVASPGQTAPRAPVRTTQAELPASHFGAATGGGLGLDVAASSGGGAGARGSLASFEAAVRARVLAGKHQPRLAWDRRNSCMIAYSVTVSRSGSLVGFSIAPCAIAAINEAARDAIRHAVLPVPPDLGAPTTEVHGSLVFQP